MKCQTPQKKTRTLHSCFRASTLLILLLHDWRGRLWVATFKSRAPEILENQFEAMQTEQSDESSQQNNRPFLWREYNPQRKHLAWQPQDTALDWEDPRRPWPGSPKARAIRALEAIGWQASAQVSTLDDRILCHEPLERDPRPPSSSLFWRKSVWAVRAVFDRVFQLDVTTILKYTEYGIFVRNILGFFQRSDSIHSRMAVHQAISKSAVREHTTYGSISLGAAAPHAASQL